MSLLNFLGRARQRVACDNIFEAELHCENSGHFGLTLGSNPEVEGLVIVNIASTPVTGWNDENPSQKIEIGCAVMKVNGITESSAMVQEFRNSKSVSILVKVGLSPKQLTLFRASRNTYCRQILVEQNLSMSDAHCGEACSICHDEMDVADTALLPCGHCFHKVCVKEWLISRSLRCPLCNDEIGKRPISLLV